MPKLSAKSKPIITPSIKKLKAPSIKKLKVPSIKKLKAPKGIRSSLLVLFRIVYQECTEGTVEESTVNKLRMLHKMMCDERQFENDDQFDDNMYQMYKRIIQIKGRLSKKEIKEIVEDIRNISSQATRQPFEEAPHPKNDLLN